MTLTDMIKRFIAGKVIFFSLAGTVAIDTGKTINPANYNALPIVNQIVKSEPIAQYSQINQEAPVQQTEAARQISALKPATYVLLWYPIGDLGYAESSEPYYIPAEWVMSKTVKEGDTIEKWWRMEEQEPTGKDLMQRIFLTINNPSYYPKRFPKYFDLNEQDLELIVGKKANFIDLNKDGKVLGEIGEYLPKEEVEKIRGLKNDRGELYNGTNRRR